MEKREQERLKAGAEYKGRLILANTVTIKDISISWICVETSERLNTNNNYRIEMISSSKEKAALSGKVIRSFIKGALRQGNDTIPFYEVGLKFLELTDNEKQFLEKFLSELSPTT